MRNLLIAWVLAAVLSVSSFGRESWLCSEDSSQIQGSTVLACGVGSGETETLARRMALNNATEEFENVCGPDTECGEHKYRVQPSRTTCEHLDYGWKCYRLVKYEIEEKLRAPTQLPHNDAVESNQMDLFEKSESQKLSEELLNKVMKSVKESL